MTEPDQLSRELWGAAIALRGAAVVIGCRRAPALWVIWVVITTTLDLYLKHLDAIQAFNDGTYAAWWVLQQVSGLFLAALIVRRLAHPTCLLFSLSAFGALIVGGTMGVTHRWPSSPVEVEMWGFGLASMTAGFTAAGAEIFGSNPFRQILAIYLILFGVLYMGCTEMLDDPGVGRAWSVLDGICFAQWSLRWTWPVSWSRLCVWKLPKRG